MVSSIKDLKEKIKERGISLVEKGRIASFSLEEVLKREHIVVVVIILLTGVASFGLGRISAIRDNKEPLTIVQNSTDTASIQSSVSKVTQSAVTAKVSQTGTVFASKNGKKYYYPNCTGASRISEANKVWFATPKEAETFGYTIASGCSPK